MNPISKHIISLGPVTKLASITITRTTTRKGCDISYCQLGF